MEKIQKYDFSKLKNLDELKEFCKLHLFDIATGVLRTEKHFVKVRFIDVEGKFGFTGLGRFFFVDNCMYIITNDVKYKSQHNPKILGYKNGLEVLEFSGEFIAQVIFAGIFTGFYDDFGERIFTGDVVSANVFINPEIPSNGGENRAKNLDDRVKGIFCEGGVNDSFGNYSFILDNHSIPLSWATKLKIIGSLFFDLKKNETEIDIQELCNNFSQTRENKDELKNTIKKSPYFTPVTWQEKALEILCGNNNEDNEEEY